MTSAYWKQWDEEELDVRDYTELPRDTDCEPEPQLKECSHDIYWELGLSRRDFL